MSTLRSIALGLVVVAAAVACGHELPGVQASPSPVATSSPPPASAAAAGSLVTVETRGGECPRGACGGTIAVEADGRVHALEPSPAELGTVPESTVEGLATEIAQADFAALKSRPFTGECPTAFDGQETIYTFTTPSGVERIASCEFVVDPEHPLFVAVSAALAVVPR